MRLKKFIKVQNLRPGKINNDITIFLVGDYENVHPYTDIFLVGDYENIFTPYIDIFLVGDCENIHPF